jgi:hypothetical protein
MYPGFEGKKNRRFADSFPGENVDVNQVLVRFHRLLQLWLQDGGQEAWTIPVALWARIAGDLHPDMRTLECGTGLSTKLFLDSECEHSALEFDRQRVEKLISVFPSCEPSLRFCPLTGDPPWYDWRPPDRPFDLVLIDGPPGTIGRRGIERVIEQLIHEDTIVYIDDALRPDEAALCDALEKRLGWPLEKSTAGHHGFARLARQPPREFC